MGRLNADIIWYDWKDPPYSLYSNAGIQITCRYCEHVTALLKAPLFQLAALVPGISATRVGMRVSIRGIVLVVFRVATAAVHCIVFVAVVITEPRVTGISVRRSVTGLAVRRSAIARDIRGKTQETVSIVLVMWIIVSTIPRSMVVRIVVGVVPLSVIVLTVRWGWVVSTIARSRIG